MKSKDVIMVTRRNDLAEMWPTQKLVAFCSDFNSNFN